jgi:FkbM family methyltransferase
MTSLKIFLRDLYAAYLALVPMSYLDPIRRRHHAGREGSLGRMTTRTLLRCLRYRRIDRRIKTFSPMGKPDVRFFNIDSLLTKKIFWLGVSGYEGMEYYWWERFCSASKSILEIGANVGFYTVLGARAAPRARYVAVEPYPPVLTVLRANLEENGLKGVTVDDRAVVAQVDEPTIEMHVPRWDTGPAPVGTFVAGRRGVATRQSRCVEVGLVDARSLVGRADLIKLDVEGCEYEVLNSIRAHVEASRPTLFVEVLREASRLRELLKEWCDSVGYRAFIPAGKRLRQIDPARILKEDFEIKSDTKDLILAMPERIPK